MENFNNYSQQSELCGKTIAVVVTFNRKELLKECVQALLNQNEDSLRVLIVDNGSTDGTADYISDMLTDGRVLYRNTGANLGGAGGFNFGIREAMKSDCEYIWLMDDDCIVNDNSLTELISYAKRLNGDFGFLSSSVRWTDGSVCKMNVQRKSITSSIDDFNKHNQQIVIATFVSLLLKREAVAACGLPIKEFFIWGDDWEYTGRISQKYKNYFVPTSIVTHKSVHNGGSDIVKDGRERLGRYFYAYRNEKYLFDKMGLKGKIYYALKIAYHRFKILLSGTPDKKEKLSIIKKGLKAAKTFKPDIEFAD